jgi:hypothetical protein
VSIKTIKDCIKRSAETGLSVEALAEIHGIKTGSKKRKEEVGSNLLKLRSNKDKFKLLDKTPKSEGDIRDVILRSILTNAMTQKERFEVLRETKSESELEEMALRELLKHSATQEERWEIYDSAPHWSEIEEEIFEAIIKNDTSNN